MTHFQYDHYFSVFIWDFITAILCACFMRRMSFLFRFQLRFMWYKWTVGDAERSRRTDWRRKWPNLHLASWPSTADRWSWTRTKTGSTAFIFNEQMHQLHVAGERSGRRRPQAMRNVCISNIVTNTPARADMHVVTVSPVSGRRSIAR